MHCHDGGVTAMFEKLLSRELVTAAVADPSETCSA